MAQRHNDLAARVSEEEITCTRYPHKLNGSDDSYMWVHALSQKSFVVDCEGQHKRVARMKKELARIIRRAIKEHENAKAN